METISSVGSDPLSAKMTLESSCCCVLSADAAETICQCGVAQYIRSVWSGLIHQVQSTSQPSIHRLRTSISKIAIVKAAFPGLIQQPFPSSVLGLHLTGQLIPHLPGEGC